MMYLIIYHGKKDDTRDPCSVCHEKMPLWNIVTTRCGHTFCQECFGTWTLEQRKDTCPLCRQICTGAAKETQDTFQFFRQNAIWPVFVFLFQCIYGLVSLNGDKDCKFLDYTCFFTVMSAMIQYLYFNGTDNGKFNAFGVSVNQAINVYDFQMYSIIAATLFPKFAFLWSALTALLIYQELPKLQIGRFVYICSVFLTSAVVPALMRVSAERLIPLTSWLVEPHAVPNGACVLAQACATYAALLLTYIASSINI